VNDKEFYCSCGNYIRVGKGTTGVHFSYEWCKTRPQDYPECNVCFRNLKKDYLRYGCISLLDHLFRNKPAFQYAGDVARYMFNRYLRLVLSNKQLLFMDEVEEMWNKFKARRICKDYSMFNYSIPYAKVYFISNARVANSNDASLEELAFLRQLINFREDLKYGFDKSGNLGTKRPRKKATRR